MTDRAIDRISSDPHYFRIAKVLHPQDAEEVYQEALTRVAEAEAKGTVIKSLPDYYFMVLRNTITERHRRHQRVRPVEVTPEVPEQDCPPPDEISGFLDMLDAPAPSKRDFYKQEVVKRVIEVGSVAEAAKVLNIKKSSIYYCIRVMREKYQELQG